MRLKTLIKSIGFSLPSDLQDVDIKGITADSRKVKAGFISVAVKGKDFDGHGFIKEAIQQGARAVVIQDSWPQLLSLTEARRMPGGLIKTAIPATAKVKEVAAPGGIPQTALRCGQQGHNGKIACIKVSDTRQALAKLVAQFYGQPSLNLKVVGITGTNGKTTVSYLIEAILKAARCNPAVIGTINYRFKNRIFNASNTTPGSEQLQTMLVQMQKEKVDYVVMETSSHALDQARVEAVNFSTAIFTNLTGDHLDYHGDLNSYFSAKSKLFKGLGKDSFAILNIDDARGRDLIELTKACVVTYGLSNNCADVSAKDISFSLKGTEFLLRLRHSSRKNLAAGANGLKLSTPLIGKHNIYNILAAVAFGLIQKIDPEAIREAIKNFTGVPGRLERVPVGDDFSVFIDYAHTEDAIANVIRSLRPLCKGRLCVVFGCGGDRDKTKRPRMGRVVSELADLAIVTTDNPRNEEPENIISEVVSGMDKQNFRVIVERKEAIREALSQASKNDMILIAGKGHEDYQVFKDKIIHFNDREVVRECLLPLPLPLQH